MEFVPYQFCDSVIFIANPKTVRKLKKLVGYWRRAARNPAIRMDIELEVILVKASHWKCRLRDWNTGSLIDNWEELIAANHCLVLNAVTVMTWERGRIDKTLSTAELMKLLLYCYKKPFEWEYRTGGCEMTDEEWTRTMQLFENFHICRIELRYEPGCLWFLCRALDSQHLVGICIRGLIPDSLYAKISYWAHRVEFEEMHIDESPYLQFDFSVFEKLMRRIEGGHARFQPNGRKCLHAHFSEADCEKIRNFLGTSDLVSTYEVNADEYVERWKKENVSVRIRKSRNRHWGVVTC